MAGLCPGCLLREALNEEDDPHGFSSESGPAGLAAGTSLGPFRIGRLIGKGGMAAVYEAHEAPPLERTVALKVLPPEFLHDDTFARRFAHEARVIASLEHASIVPVYASGIDGGIPWISMRLLTGGSLSTLLQQHGPLSVERTTRMLEELADALDYSHARGVMHRDIKPSNILLDDTGRAYLCDFGLARLVTGIDHVTRTGALLGTPHYMAPEQAVSANVDGRCDTYSLGVVAYEMLAGSPPYDGDTPLAVLMQHATAPVPTILRDRCPESTSLAIEKALAKNPDDRWQSAKAFVGALDASVSRPARGGQWIRIASAATVTLTIAGAGAYWLRPEAPARGTTLATGKGDIRLTVPATGVGGPQKGHPSAGPAEIPRSPVGTQPDGNEESPIAPPAAPQPEPPPTGTVPPGGTQPPAPEPLSNVADPAPPAAAPVMTEPVVRRRFDPRYPEILLNRRIYGVVALSGTVRVDGRVGGVSVLRSSGNQQLDEAAKDAFRKWEFEPARRDGVPVERTFRHEFSFGFSKNER